jgi:clan AA aspartic protease (TIGR02281 family)
MRLLKAAAATGLLLAAACEEMTGTSAAPEYRPEESGSVDQAMCLLGFEAVPLREVRTGHHLVEATIDGTTARFVLDTGANVTVVERSHAGRFGLSPRSGAAAALGALQQGAAQASQASVGSFEIGALAIRQNDVVLADMAQLLGALGQVAGEEVVGVIGQDVLKEHRAIIDVARPMLYLMEEDRDPAPVPAERCTGAD